MNAITGKILEIDLKKAKWQVSEIPTSTSREYLGGYGLGVKLLMDRMDPRANPLGPGNILGMAAGYLTGTGAIAADRYMVFGKSPSTRGWGDANCGGFFGKRLKQSGFDVILFSEISPKPVYLFVNEGQVELRNANFIWGKDCYETEDQLKEIHGKDCEVACIGPAGENLSKIAGISTDKGRMAARSALGAVMGSKKVKAVVVKGKQKIGIADRDQLKMVRKKYSALMKVNPLVQGLSKFGTSLFFQGCLKGGDTPVKNWSAAYNALEKDDAITEDKMEDFRVKKYVCSSCHIGCGGHEKVDEGQYQTQTPVHKVEYETMGLLGPNLLNESADSLVKINDLCNRYGMDTIGCGGLCAYAIECFENGLISLEQTGGLQLRWGNTDAIITLVEQIGKSEGIGGILAKGFYKSIKVFGKETEKYAMAIRNEAIPAHDPRWSAGLALTYYSDATPARHTQGSTTFPVAGYEQPVMTNEDLSGRAKYHKDNVNLVHALSCSGLCTFCFSVMDYKALPEFLSAVDGTEWTNQEFMETGYRIFVLRHLFNLQAGINFKDFTFPNRVLGNPPLKDGPTKDVSIDLDVLVSEFLEEMGFDKSSTCPPEVLLENLNILEYATGKKNMIKPSVI
jgi:aldehyde:ferredoxin oxidoreductase